MTDIYRVTSNGVEAYKAKLNKERTCKYLYVRVKETKNGREFKVDAGRTAFFTRIAHLFKRSSTHYYYGQDAVNRINNLSDFKAKVLGVDTNEHSKEGDSSKSGEIPDEEGSAVDSLASSSDGEKAFESVEPPQGDEAFSRDEIPLEGDDAFSGDEIISDGAKKVPEKELKKTARVFKRVKKPDFPEYNPADFGEDVQPQDPPGIKEGANIPKNMQFESFLTLGDGSCGLHALFGTLQNGKYVCDNAASLRKEYCDHLREKMPDDSPFRDVLTDYFHRFNDATTPSIFRNNPKIQKAYDDYHSQYDSLDMKAQEEMLARWLNDENVLEGYFNYLEDPRNWLLQEELLDMAKFFDQTVYLVQNWGNTGEIEGLESPIFEGTKEPVYIWYVPEKHYERAAYYPKK